MAQNFINFYAPSVTKMNNASSLATSMSKQKFERFNTHTNTHQHTLTHTLSHIHRKSPSHTIILLVILFYILFIQNKDTFIEGGNGGVNCVHARQRYVMHDART